MSLFLSKSAVSFALFERDFRIIVNTYDYSARGTTYKAKYYSTKC